jgi:hypothetical protein
MACTAVGKLTPYGHTLIERWDGVRWAVQTPGDPGNYGSDPNVAGVSCASGAACVAVGYYTVDVNDAELFRPLAEHWDGRHWSLQHVVVPSDATRQSLRYEQYAAMDGVSCVARSACMAVGSYHNNANPDFGSALVEHWDGHAWLPEAAAQPPGTFQSLSGVSCVPEGACVAVGTYGNPAGGGLLVERSVGPPTATVAITRIRATPVAPGCETETGTKEREARAVTADVTCRHFRLTVRGAIRIGRRLAHHAHGFLTVTVTAMLPRGPTMRTAEGAVTLGGWRVSLILPGVNRDPLPPLYLIIVRYHGDPTIGRATAARHIRIESERVGL